MGLVRIYSNKRDMTLKGKALLAHPVQGIAFEI